MTDPIIAAAAAVPPVTAPAPNSPAVAQRFAGMDDLVKVNVYGKEQVIPVSMALKDYQTSAAGRQAIEEAKRIRSESHVDHEHAERWRLLEHQLKTNPEQAFQGLERLAGVSRQIPTGDSQLESTPSSLPDRKTSDLEEKVRRLELAQNQSDLKGRIKEALDSTEFTRTNAAARKAAEKQLLAYQIVDPASDPRETIREIHTELLELYSSSATQQRDQRAEQQRTMPNVPASVGMPDLSDIPQGTEADFKAGKFKENFMRAAARFGNTLAGNI